MGEQLLADSGFTAIELARAQVRDGLPLRARLNVVAFLARKPEGD